MAKPDLNNGWFMLAYELLPPLMVCCQRAEASIVLCEVLAQVYGSEKRKTAKLKPAKIADRAGVKRENIWRGIKELTDKGVLERLGDGTFRFEKDYEKWTTPSGPVVPPPLADYAVDFIEISKGREPKKRRPKSVSRVDTISEETNGSSVSRVDTLPESASVSKGDTVSVSRVDTVGVSKGDTLSAPPPNRELKIERVVVGVESETTVPVIESDNASKKTNPPAIWSQRPFKPAPADLLRVKELVEAIDPHAYLGQKVQAISTLYPLDWIEAAFTLAAGQGDRIANYANNTLIRWWRQGAMDEVEAFGPKPPRQSVAPSPLLAPRVPAFLAKREAELAAMKNYVPKSLRNKESSS